MLVRSFAGRDLVGRDVNLSPNPGLVEDKPGQVSPFPFFLNSTGCLEVMETLVLQRIRYLVTFPLALLNLPVRLPVGSETFLQVESTLSPTPFPSSVWISVGTCFGCLCFFLFWPVFSPRRRWFSTVSFLAVLIHFFLWPLPGQEFSHTFPFCATVCRLLFMFVS